MSLARWRTEFKYSLSNTNSSIQLTQLVTLFQCLAKMSVVLKSEF